MQIPQRRALTGSMALLPQWPLLLAQRLLQLALIPLWLNLKPHSTGFCTLPGLIAGSETTLDGLLTPLTGPLMLLANSQTTPAGIQTF